MNASEEEFGPKAIEAGLFAVQKGQLRLITVDRYIYRGAAGDLGKIAG
ncbi:hypothetical protein AB0D59_24610 [Streptomyces sp. NPDC048417]